MVFQNFIGKVMVFAININLYKNQGNDPKRRYNFDVIGYNYRITNLQAAFGLAQVERSKEILEGSLGQS